MRSGAGIAIRLARLVNQRAPDQEGKPAGEIGGRSAGDRDEDRGQLPNLRTSAHRGLMDGDRRRSGTAPEPPNLGSPGADEGLMGTVTGFYCQP